MIGIETSNGLMVLMLVKPGVGQRCKVNLKEISLKKIRTYIGDTYLGNKGL